MNNTPEPECTHNKNRFLSKEALSHIPNEIGLTNIFISLKSNFETISKVHNSIHEFIYLAPLCLPSTAQANWHQRSAFLIYHWEIFNLTHRSLFEALAGYYNAAFTLLRSALELIIKGAFFECLAHKEFRERSEVLDKNKSGKRLKDMINRTIGDRVDIEETSAIIHDMLTAKVDDKVFVEQQEYRPSIKTVVKQLASWEMLNPIKNSEKLYSIYELLSADVHVIPDRTDIGRRLLSQKDIFEAEIMLGELDKFLGILLKVMDMAIVIELNILSNWIEQNGRTKAKLKKRLTVMENLGLKLSSEKLRSLTRQ